MRASGIRPVSHARAAPCYLQVYGPESSGKTTLALHAMAEVQKSGGTAALIDAEHAFDPEYSKVSGKFQEEARSVAGLLADGLQHLWHLSRQSHSTSALCIPFFEPTRITCMQLDKCCLQSSR